MSTNNDDLRSVVRDSAANATELMGFISSRTDNPVLAMASLMLACSVFARSIGMDRADYLEGTGAAFDSLQEATHHATH
jgi:hypothetical protein